MIFAILIPIFGCKITKKLAYLQKKVLNICVYRKKAVLLHPLSEKKWSRLRAPAGWMSDLVSGLQNRLERFDSATGLQAACQRAA